MWEWFVTALENTGDFESRARRREYWSFVGGQSIIMLASLLLAGLLTTYTDLEFWPFVTVGFLALVLMVPGLAVTVRRLHDTDRSGWFIMLPIVPFGSLILIYFLLKEGTHGENRYGLDPKDSFHMDEPFLLEAPYEDELALEDWRDQEPEDLTDDEEDFWDQPYEN